MVWVQNVSTLAYCDYKVEKTRHFCRFYWMLESSKVFSFRGLRPLTPRPGTLPLDPAGGSAPRPPYRVALHALAMSPSQTQFLDPPLPWTPWDFRPQTLPALSFVESKKILKICSVTNMLSFCLFVNFEQSYTKPPDYIGTLGSLSHKFFNPPIFWNYSRLGYSRFLQAA